MSIHAGAILPPVLYANSQYGAAYKFLAPRDTLPYQGLAVGWPINVGALSVNLPITAIVAGLSGNKLRLFEQDWYHHIHLLPARFTLGNLLSTQVRQVEVWNAHFAPQSLSSVVGQNDGGITLAAAAQWATLAPTTYGMLESRLHNVSVSLDGPPVIETSFTFQFPDEAPVLQISGRRVVVFGLKPNWADGWLERLIWATDVLTARDGSEQRVSLRAKPRRSLEFSILVEGADAALLDVLLSAWQSRVYALPIWPDKSFLAVAITAGSTVIPMVTTNLEYEADGLLVIGSDSRNTEAAEVLSVAANAVTLKQPLLQNWPAGAFVAPARTARLRVSQTISKVTDAISTARLVFDIAGTTEIAKQDSILSFNSTPVWTIRPNRVRDVETDYRRLAEVLDFDTGITAVDDHAARPFVRRAFDYLFKNRNEITTFKAWLAARQGRLTAFWHPTWEASIVPVKKILSNQTVMTVASRGYALYFNPMPGRTEVAFLHKNGNWYFRSIQGFSAGATSDEEVMMINQPFGFDAHAEDWVAIYFLEKTRLDADQIELNWQTDSVVEASVPMLSVK